MLRSLLIAIAFASANVSADCRCGYMVNGTTDPNFAVFTESIETDFLHVSNLIGGGQGQWIAQAFNVSPAEANGPYGKAAQVQNVVPNPVQSKWNWQSPGIRGNDPGLQLWVKQDLIDSPDGSGSMVPMAEIASQRNDILYGSFRIGMKTTAVNGTCGAFFFYFSNSQEIDMELLSTAEVNDGGYVNLVVQSPQSAAVGFVNRSSSDFDEYNLPFAPQMGDNEFRFDWLPDRIEFYANGVQLRSITDNVPNVPGAIHVNHWSNGNPGWTAGPPQSDAVLTITYIKAYFNSSESDSTAKALRGCPVGTAPGQLACEIPTQTVPPDTGGANGNSTGRTFFFSDPEDTNFNPTSTSTVVPASGSPKHGGAPARSSLLGWSTISFTTFAVLVGALVMIVVR